MSAVDEVAVARDAGAGLAARGVSFRIGDREVFGDVDVTARPGNVVALVGPSGSGKTSLLTMLGGLTTPTAGVVLLDGAPLPTGAHASFGLILQGYALVTLLTARENVEAGLRAGGHSAHGVRDVAARALAEVGLAEQADRLVDRLSGGQQQRVAIARALAREPRIVLADEPTAEQDPESRALIEARLFAVAASGGIVVLATHDTQLADRCDVVVDLASL